MTLRTPQEMTPRMERLMNRLANRLETHPLNQVCQNRTFPLSMLLSRRSVRPKLRSRSGHKSVSRSC